MSEKRICHQKDCDMEATDRYTWPGKNESFICEQHASQAAHIASAMGMHLQFIPLEDQPDA